MVLSSRQCDAATFQKKFFEIGPAACVFLLSVEGRVGEFAEGFPAA